MTHLLRRQAERGDPREGEKRPQPGDAPSTEGDGQHQRTEDFDRHGDAQRNTRDRLVKAEIHGGEGSRQGRSGAQGTTRESPNPRADGDTEHDACHREAGEGGSARAECGKQPNGERGSDFLRGRGAHHE
jgi:hypothetical protein